MEKQHFDFLNTIKLRGIAGQPKTQQFEGKTLISFPVMTEALYRSKDSNTLEVTWLPVKYWNPSESPVPNIMKNQSVVEVEGRIRMKRYTRPNGEEITYCEVLAQKMTVLGTTGNLTVKAQFADCSHE